MSNGFTVWRRVHLASSGLLGLIALAHSALTPVFYHQWTPDAVWFLGTGMGLLLLAALNWTHIGVEPCRFPTTRLVRVANWIFVALGVAAIFAVPEPQTYVLVACLVGQAIAARFTLPGNE